MHVEIGTVAVLFLFWEYLFLTFRISSLQCEGHDQSDEGLLSDGKLRFCNVNELADLIIGIKRVVTQ
jgi:hypothetical protein